MTQLLTNIYRGLLERYAVQSLDKVDLIRGSTSGKSNTMGKCVWLSSSITWQNCCPKLSFGISVTLSDPTEIAIET